MIVIAAVVVMVMGLKPHIHLRQDISDIKALCHPQYKIISSSK